MIPNNRPPIPNLASETPYNFEKMYTAERISNLRRCFSKTGISLVLALVIMYIVTFAMSFAGITSTDNNEYSYTITNIASSIASIIAFISAGLFCCAMSKVSAGSIISFTANKDKKPFIGYILIISFSLFMVSNYMTSIFLGNMEFIGFPISQSSSDYKVGWFSTLIAVISIAVVPALAEEFLFRGVVLGILRKFGDSFAVITSSIFFGFMHQNFIQLPFAFIGGLVLAYITIYTGSITPAIAVHFANNLFSYIFTTLPVYIGSEISDTIYMIIIVISAVLSFLSIYKLSKTDKNLLRFDPSMENEYSDILTSEGLKYKYFFQSYGTIVFLVLLFAISIYTSVYIFSS